MMTLTKKSGDIKVKKISEGSLVELPPVFAANNSYILLACEESVKIYSTNSCELVGELQQGSHIVALHVHHHNPQQLLVCSADRRVITWDFINGVRVHECALHLEENHKLVNFMVRWKDDTWYAKVHNKKRGSKLQVLALLGKKEKSLKPITILSDINDVPHALAFGAHDDFLAGISGKRLCLHSFKTQDKRFYFSGDFDLTCIACHPYQPVVATGNTLGRIIIWNDIWEQHYVRYYVHWHHLPVSDLAFSVDGTFLVSGGAENVLVRWRLEDETKEFIPRMGSPIVHITVAPDNAFIAIAHELNAVTLVSGNLTVVGKIQGLLQRVHWSEEQPCVKPMAVGLRSDPRSRSLVLNGIPGHLLFYSPELQKCLFHLDVTGVNQLNKQEGALIINSEVEHACFSDDGSHLATVERRDDGHNTPEIRLKFWLFRPHVGTYEMSTQIEYPHWKPMLALAFSGGNNPESCASISQDGFVKLWLHEIESVEGEEGEYWTYGPKASYCDCIPTCLSYSDDESLLAVGFGSVISLFHTPSLERLACLSESLELVQEVKFGRMECGHRLAVSTEKHLYVWDIPSLSIAWKVPLCPHLIVSSSSSPFMALFAMPSDVYVFTLVSEKPVFAEKKVLPEGKTVLSAVFSPYCPKRDDKKRRKTPLWMQEETLFFMSSDQVLYCLDQGDQKPKRIGIGLSMASEVSTLYSHLIAAKHRSDAEKQVSLYPSRHKSTSTRSDIAILELLSSPSHMLPPMPRFCRNFITGSLEPIFHRVEEEGPKKVEKLQNREVELMELDTEDKGEVIRSGRREEVNLKEEDDVSFMANDYSWLAT